MIKNQSISDTQSYGVIKSILSIDGVDGAKITVRGFSMSPFIKDGTIVTLARFDKSKGVKLGDVVAARSACKETIIVHRVIGKKKNLVLLKGDNNIQNDGWLPESRIIGVVEKTDGNRLFNTTCKPINMFIAIGSGVGLFNRLRFPVFKTLQNLMIKSLS